MIALVNDLLEVSRIEQGESKLYLLPTDLTQIIRSLLRDRESEIKNKQLNVQFTVEHEPFPVVRTEHTRAQERTNALWVIAWGVLLFALGLAMAIYERS